MTTCNENGCDEVGNVQLQGPVELCDAHFKERCADESRPAMGYMFGPTVLEVKYDPVCGDAVPDSKVLDYVSAAIKEFTEGNCDTYVTVGAELLILAFRAAVYRGDIEAYHLMLRVDGELYEFNSLGKFMPFNKWPDGISDIHHGLLMELL